MLMRLCGCVGCVAVRLYILRRSAHLEKLICVWICLTYPRIYAGPAHSGSFSLSQTLSFFASSSSSCRSSSPFAPSSPGRVTVSPIWNLSFSFAMPANEYIFFPPACRARKSGRIYSHSSARWWIQRSSGISMHRDMTMRRMVPGFIIFAQKREQ